MSIDILQEKIRKMKNPSVIDMSISKEHIPPHLYQQEPAFIRACGRFCTELLLALKDTVPAVRFSFSKFALMGTEGLDLLSDLTATAKQAGFYVLLDGPELYSEHGAQEAAEALFSAACPWMFDTLVLCSYIGADGLKPYVERLKDSDKSVLVMLRTANRSAAELQDLLSGSRLAHLAKADLVNRLGLPLPGSSGYSRIGGIGAATSADVLRNLRAKYKNMFLLLDGYDYSNANAKNCSFAFDKFGHGAAACAGASVTAAWLDEEDDGQDFTQSAIRAAERMKKNLLRYVTVL